MTLCIFILISGWFVKPVDYEGTDIRFEDTYQEDVNGTISFRLPEKGVELIFRDFKEK